MFRSESNNKGQEIWRDNWRLSVSGVDESGKSEVARVAVGFVFVSSAVAAKLCVSSGSVNVALSLDFVVEG